MAKPDSADIERLKQDYKRAYRAWTGGQISERPGALDYIELRLDEMRALRDEVRNEGTKEA